MYPLEPFQSSDRAKLDLVMRAYPLATLITQGPEAPMVTMVPLVLAGDRLRGHFDGNNPHGAAMLREPRTYVLFQGPNHYMSPSIYPTEQYPGWNYFAVHVEAVARPLSLEENRALLFRLAELHEPSGSGYVLATSQKNFERFLGMIFGFELAIESVRGVLKLAQDKGADHAALAATELAERSRRDIGPLLDELLK